ncbi:hypothetical protein [Clostridium baratii]|uniref:hypothetical protein n=1 Tax=Clostridium baratii TaxID=1561 RepID=UPI0030CFD9CC
MMNEKIKKALDSIGVKCFFQHRGDYKGECVVYTHISNPLSYADNRETVREYTILLNVYSKEDIENKNEMVRKVMIKNGFRGGIVKTPMLLENGFTNTAIQFKGYLLES